MQEQHNTKCSFSALLYTPFGIIIAQKSFEKKATEVFGLDQEEIRERVINDYINHVNPSLFRLLAFMGVDQVEDHADGWKVWDTAGNEWIDCLGGFGVFSVGHRRKEIIDAAKVQLDKMPMSSKILLNKPMADLSAKLAAITPEGLQYSFICNSGTEATEAALKLAKIYTKKREILYTVNAFHGKTLGSLSVTGRDKYQKPVEPLLPGCSSVPFGDVSALVRAINDSTACFIVEPVQGEGGVYVPDGDYLHRAAEICREAGVILIIDEVQTGFGRTGYMFACERFGVKPDIMTLAKALGGGVMPIGAVMATSKIWSVFEENPLIHSSTFGGNPLACAVALKTIEIIQREDFPLKAVAAGTRFLKGLRELQGKYPDIVTDVRGMGLLIGIEFPDDDIGGLFISAIVSRHILVGFTLNNPKVIRIEPPLDIDDETIDFVLTCVDAALEDVRELLKELE